MTDDPTAPPAKSAPKTAAKPRAARAKAPANKPKEPAAKVGTAKTAAANRGSATRSTARKAASPKPAAGKRTAATKAKTSAQKLVKQVEDSVADVTATAEKATKEAETMARDVTKRATKVMEDLRIKAEDSGRKIEDALSQATGSLSRMPEMQAKATDAMTASQQAISTGVSDLSNAVLAFAKSAMTEGYDAAKAVATAATIKDVVQVQTEFAKSRLQSSMEYTQQLVDIVTRMSQASTQSMVAGANEIMAIMRGGAPKR